MRHFLHHKGCTIVLQYNVREELRPFKNKTYGKILKVSCKALVGESTEQQSDLWQFLASSTFVSLKFGSFHSLSGMSELQTALEVGGTVSRMQ